MLDIPNPRLEQWLTRLAQLSAADWGRLDAASAPLGGRGPVAMVRRARLLGQLFRIIPGLPPFVVTSFVLGRDLWDLATGAVPVPAGRPPMPARARSPGESASRAYYAECQRRLDAVVADAPGTATTSDGSDRSGLQRVLGLAWVGLALGPELPADALRSLYAPIESVIPLDSLGDMPALAVSAAAG